MSDFEHKLFGQMRERSQGIPEETVQRWIGTGAVRQVAQHEVKFLRTPEDMQEAIEASRHQPKSEMWDRLAEASLAEIE